MKIAITGGAGFIGSRLAQAYLDAGHTVLIIDNLLHGFRAAIDARARFYEIDIRDEKLRTILQMERPDVVSHHATIWEPRFHPVSQQQTLLDADIHIRGLLHVLACSVNASVGKFIFASNGNGMYGQTETALPLSEETPLHPQTASDIAKVTGEEYVRYYTQQYGMAHSILRYADVYGETDYTQAHHPITHFIHALLEQQRPIIRGTGNERRDSIFIDDVVSANIQALTRGKNQTLHISNGLSYSLNQLYTLIASCLDSEREPLHLTSSMQVDEERVVSLDNTRACQSLSWRPQYDLFDGVEEAIKRLQGQIVPAIAAIEEAVVLSSAPMLAHA